MKIKQKRDLTLGESVTAASQLCGAGQREKMVRLAINAPLVVFREQPHPLIFSTKGKFA
jgi:hypothetical protein